MGASLADSLGYWRATTLILIKSELGQAGLHHSPDWGSVVVDMSVDPRIER
jgi:hypothetical protein